MSSVSPVAAGYERGLRPSPTATDHTQSAGLHSALRSLVGGSKEAPAEAGALTPRSAALRLVPMATKKQRRRREKEHRHEYEYVYIDEEGKEVEVEQPPSSQREKARRPAASANGRRPAQIKPVQPPSWRYLRKQALIFFFIILVAFTVLNKGKPIYFALGMAVIYTAIMIPLMWMTQRMIYRSYLRRTGQLPPPRKRGSK